ncbi:MAG: 16S rRNA (adenine(1518)-N(6)/adenine(1519)-N(6))-dimethyltransferase RsmA [Phycisphaerae bacterium]|nr:16S rRNA (adenine(1518)-N(6)/adenine(1519)-N(6))-dimethyltransferase RsmA [Phycisphaerae bacterium]
MQTKRQIQELLSAAGVSPNRRLGQHFLVDLNLMRLLVDSAQIGPRDVVLEVGTGTGSLTEALAQQAGHVVTVELDRTLAGIAQSRLAGAENVQVLNIDVLAGKGTIHPTVAEAVTQAHARLHNIGPTSSLGPTGPAPGRVLLVSNLPYDVASSVMIDLVKGPVTVDAMFVTVQKEVAARMTAPPGGRDYGTLSIFLQATGEVELLRRLRPSVFWPPPGVDSAIVRSLRDPDKSRRILDMDVFGGVVGLFIGHRRKMLRACIKQAPPELGGRDLWPQILEQDSIDPTRRPEELSPEQYVAMANACCRLLSAR